MSIMQTFRNDVRNPFIAQPDRANRSTIKYPLKLRKPLSFKILFHSFVMRWIRLNKMTQPSLFFSPLRDNSLWE